MTELEGICAPLRQEFEERNAAREAALALSREIIRSSANAIRNIHRGETETARQLAAHAGELVRRMRSETSRFVDLNYTGYIHDAQKEYTEASCVIAILTGEPLPSPLELGVESPAYLNGLGETVGEMRRYILDRIRAGDAGEAEAKLAIADDVYYALVQFDYPDALTGGLRRTADAMRGILERTRGDVTNALRQQRLEEALRDSQRPLADG